MPTSPANRLIDQLLLSVPPGDGERRADGELLTRYVESRDEVALAALVRRHGSLVRGVCCRLLRNPCDAEDAFQATFLVLVRKAASVSPREMVGNWLYGVAHQAALQARRAVTRRRTREVQVADMPEIPAAQPVPSADVRAVLDEELIRLPDIYRAVVVLCDLEGRTRKEAARQLGVPDGTVGGRLARARTMLAKRLARRGVTLSAGALAAAVSHHAASAGVPNAVVLSAIKAASLVAAGQAASTAVPVGVAALTEGVLKAMLITKIKATVVALLLVAAVGCGAGLLVYGAAPGQQRGGKAGSAAAPQRPDGDPTTANTSGEQPAAGLPSAPPGSELRKSEGTVSAPVIYKDTMLVLVTKTGVAAVVFTRETEKGVDYKYRYESSDGKTQLSGSGKLNEKDAGGRAFDSFIEAGPIPLRWSYADDGKGWVYYDPALVSVNVTNAADFEDREEPAPFGGAMTVKKLDLKRFVRP